ncbi:glutathione S-transferase N-terminal domain-containing protein [uncultured Amphritea sp.]|uniref:glutathione S-transferase N-terminal domain-containing protein n=1 Tax=uncultured Amphritea sp. TaxID=981605 RepID=UPI001DE06D9F|nr:glutathione S-transferase N-terminal domain-containing protein [uncultured Amphritea sp.]MBR9869236.1 glutaredoxin [Oceanospirillales bacterium]MBR9889418.1 glutaredoxin [Oceanospirillales bacterium]
MAFIRWFLGRIILLLNFIFSPRAFKRDPEQQRELDLRTTHLSLYQYEACPFCVKVRRALRRNGLNIEIRDAKKVEQYRNELLQGGGKLKVPCLRIDEGQGNVSWMYESSDIIHYLEQTYIESNQQKAA